MARDCPDRQRGSDWRNNGGDAGGRGPRAIGTGDAVDREMEVSSVVHYYHLHQTLTHLLATHERAVWRCSQ